MTRNRINYIASFIFASLLFLKGFGSLLPLLSSTIDNEVVCEMLVDMEKEQETKGSKMAETGINEDVFEEASLLHWFSFPGHTNSKEINNNAPALQDVYLDTVTPPPNTLIS